MALGIALGIARMGVGAINIVQGNAAAQAGLRDAARFGQQIANTRFVNKFAALQAPTKGAVLGLENIARAGQMNIEAAKEGGLRGVIGGAGRTEVAMTDAAAKIAAQLDDLQLQIDNKFLTEEQRTDIRNKQKDLRLQYARLQGAQAAATAGQNMAVSGLTQFIGGLGQTAAGVIQQSDLYRGQGNQDADGLSRKQRRQQAQIQQQMQQDGAVGAGQMDAARAKLGIEGGTDPLAIETPDTGMGPGSMDFQRSNMFVDEGSMPTLAPEMSTPASARFQNPSIPMEGTGMGPNQPAVQFIDEGQIPTPVIDESLMAPTIPQIQGSPFNLPQDDPMMQFYMNQFDNATPNAAGLRVTQGTVL